MTYQEAKKKQALALANAERLTKAQCDLHRKAKALAKQADRAWEAYHDASRVALDCAFKDAEIK